MGARFSKVLLRPDVYHAPQGVLHATADRIKGWVAKFRAMARHKLPVPVTWGHHKDALPGSSAFYLSKFNAGYLRDLTDEGGELVGGLDVPGCELDGDKLVCWTRLPDGREVKTAIADVSIAIRDFTDGQGRHWPDSIVHVALTPTPVAHGHGGFTALSLSGGYSELPFNRTFNGVRLGGGYFTLSLSQTEAGMADEEDFGGPEIAPDPPAPTPPAEPAGMNYFPQAMEYLRKQCKLALLPDTTPENFAERVCAACHAKLEGGDRGEEDGMNDDDQGTEYAGEGLTAEEPRPVMMSLSTPDITPRDRKYLERETKQHKAALSSRIAKIEKANWPAHLIAGYKERLEGYTLSLDTDTLEPVAKGLDRELSLVEEAIKVADARKGAPFKGGKPAPRPDVRPTNEPTDDEIEKRAAAVSTKR